MKYINRTSIKNIFVNPVPPYCAQYADKDNIDMFLNNPEMVKNDIKWKDFGFTHIEDYAYWSHNLCGIACLLMVIKALIPKSSIKVSELVQLALSRNAYDLPLELSKGWKYQGLIDVANEFSIKGIVYPTLTIETIIKNVTTNKYTIVSVNPQKIRLDETTDAAKGGHLVLLFGAELSKNECSSVYIHNPNGRAIQSQEKVKISISTFNDAFAGRGFSLFR